MKPAVRTPVSIATACLAGAVFVPAIPAGATLRLEPVAAERPLVTDGTVALCQVTTNSSAESAWDLSVRPKRVRDVVAGGLVPSGTPAFPGCRTALLPPGKYRATEAQKKGQPVLRVEVRGADGRTTTYTGANGRRLTGAGFGVVAGKITTVTFFNKIN